MKILRALAVIAGTSVLAAGFPVQPKDFVLKVDAKNSGDEKGKDLFKANCAVCHGLNGNGKGLAGASLNPPPGDFTQPKKLKAKSDWQRFLVVRDGGEKYGLSPSMASYKTSMSEQDIKEIILFLKALTGNAS